MSCYDASWPRLPRGVTAQFPTTQPAEARSVRVTVTLEFEVRYRVTTRTPTQARDASWRAVIQVSRPRGETLDLDTDSTADQRDHVSALAFSPRRAWLHTRLSKGTPRELARPPRGSSVKACGCVSVWTPRNGSRDVEHLVTCKRLLAIDSGLTDGFKFNSPWAPGHLGRQRRELPRLVWFGLVWLGERAA